MLMTIAFIAIAVWLVSVLANVGGAIVHFLLLVGIIMLVAHFLRRSNRSTI